MAGSPPPNVVACTLENARDALVAAGWTVGEVIETRPPRRTLEDPRRVVRQRVAADGSVELVVCGERAEGARVRSQGERAPDGARWCEDSSGEPHGVL